MTWKELRTLYPDQWVLIDALDGLTENGHGVFSLIQLIRHYSQGWAHAWEQYKILHHADKQREYYVLHTSRETLDIVVFRNPMIT